MVEGQIIRISTLIKIYTKTNQVKKLLANEASFDISALVILSP